MTTDFVLDALEGWMEGASQEVQPLGISVTFIEPGFFRTDFLDSTSITYGEHDIDDYAEAAADFRNWHVDHNHEQPGDATKLDLRCVA